MHPLIMRTKFPEGNAGPRFLSLNLTQISSSIALGLPAAGGRFLILREGRSLDAGGTLAEAVGAPLSAGPKVEIPSVDWWTTSRCNLACDFCYGPVPGKDPVDRRYDILQAIAASSARAVTFCGGEPLLVKRVDEYAAVLRQRGKSTVLNTNGELLRRRLDQGFSLGNFDMVGISVEGSTPDVHRAMRGKKADLDEVIEAVRLVTKEPGVSLKLGTVVSAVNRADLPALARTVRDLGPGRLAPVPVQQPGRPEHRPAAALAYGRRVPAPGRGGHGPGRAGTDGAVQRSRDRGLPHRRPGRQCPPAGWRRVTSGSETASRNRWTASGRKCRPGPRSSGTSAGSPSSAS